MPSEASRKKAEEMAEYLLTNGAGKKAVRLMLLGADEEDFGGWGPGPLTEMFAAALDEARAEGRATADQELYKRGLLVGAERERWECYRTVDQATRGAWDDAHRSRNLIREAIAARGPMRGPEEDK